MKTEIVKPVLRWPGGKRRLLKKLLPMIPPHICYCEPFIGGGAVLFAKPRSEVEVINDLNGDLVALYLNAQRHLGELLEQVQSFVSSRQIFHMVVQQPGMTEIERAARFLLRSRISFGGNMNISYERCFANYDSKDTFFFIDPPYLNAKIKAYQGWDEAQMRTFRRHLGKLKGKWIVTLDDSEFNRQLFSDFKIEAVSSRNQSAHVNKGLTFGELIITQTK